MGDMKKGNPEFLESVCQTHRQKGNGNRRKMEFRNSGILEAVRAGKRLVYLWRASSKTPCHLVGPASPNGSISIAHTQIPKFRNSGIPLSISTSYFEGNGKRQYVTRNSILNLSVPFDSLAMPLRMAHQYQTIRDIDKRMNSLQDAGRFRMQ